MSGVTPEAQLREVVGRVADAHGLPEEFMIRFLDKIVPVFDAWREGAAYGLPGRVPSRPTREALIAILFYVDHDKHVFNFADPRLTLEDDEHLGQMLDALLAANNLWAAPVGAPVVDREALAKAMFDATHGPQMLSSWYAVSEIERVRYRAHSDRLIASGLFVDRVTVEAEQREKDAEIAHSAIQTMHVGVDCAHIIAAAIRAPGEPAAVRAGETP